MSDATTVRPADRNLLLGVLAWQRDSIGQSALVAALEDWVFRKDTPLGQILVEQGILSAERRTFLETLVQAHVQRHGNDAAQSLAAVRLQDTLRVRLGQIADSDLQASLAALPAADADPHARFAPLPPRPRRKHSWGDELIVADAEPRSLPSPRWFRGHGNLVGAGAASLLITVVAVAAGLWLKREAEARDRAEREKTEAERAVLELVNARVNKLLLRTDVLADLREDPTIPEPLRQQALALAEGYVQSPNLLNNTSWEIVLRPGSSAEQYHWAWRLADTACRISADDGYLLNTLGAAQYRTGKFAEALKTLARSEKLNRARHGSSHPADLAFLAMTHQQLGQRDLAHEYLERLRQAMAAPEWERDGEHGAILLREANAVVLEPGAVEP